jgi:hypothetical protein
MLNKLAEDESRRKRINDIRAAQRKELQDTNNEIMKQKISRAKEISVGAGTHSLTHSLTLTHLLTHLLTHSLAF